MYIQISFMIYIYGVKKSLLKEIIRHNATHTHMTNKKGRFIHREYRSKLIDMGVIHYKYIVRNIYEKSRRLLIRHEILLKLLVHTPCHTHQTHTIVLFNICQKKTGTLGEADKLAFSIRRKL